MQILHQIFCYYMHRIHVHTQLIFVMKFSVCLDSQISSCLLSCNNHLVSISVMKLSLSYDVLNNNHTNKNSSITKNKIHLMLKACIHLHFGK